MTEQELLDLLSNAGIEGVDVVRFLAAVDRFEDALIRLLVKYGGKDDAKASLSNAQAETAAATADGWDEVGDAFEEGVDDPDRH